MSCIDIGRKIDRKFFRKIQKYFFEKEPKKVTYHFFCNVKLQESLKNSNKVLVFYQNKDFMRKNGIKNDFIIYISITNCIECKDSSCKNKKYIYGLCNFMHTPITSGSVDCDRILLWLKHYFVKNDLKLKEYRGQTLPYAKNMLSLNSPFC